MAGVAVGVGLQLCSLATAGRRMIAKHTRHICRCVRRGRALASKQARPRVMHAGTARPGHPRMPSAMTLCMHTFCRMVKGSMIQTGTLSKLVTSVPMYCWNCRVPHADFRSCAGRMGPGRARRRPGGSQLPQQQLQNARSGVQQFCKDVEQYLVHTVQYMCWQPRLLHHALCHVYLISPRSCVRAETSAHGR